jgi:hypothetical protein
MNSSHPILLYIDEKSIKNRLLNIDPSTVSPVFEGGAKNRRSELALSKPKPLGWGSEGFTLSMSKG